MSQRLWTRSKTRTADCGVSYDSCTIDVQLEVVWARVESCRARMHFVLSTVRKDMELQLTRRRNVKSCSDLVVQPRQENFDDKLLEHSTDSSWLLIEFGGYDCARTLDKSQCGIKQCRYVERTRKN